MGDGGKAIQAQHLQESMKVDTSTRTVSGAGELHHRRSSSQGHKQDSPAVAAKRSSEVEPTQSDSVVKTRASRGGSTKKASTSSSTSSSPIAGHGSSTLGKIRAKAKAQQATPAFGPVGALPGLSGAASSRALAKPASSSSDERAGGLALLLPRLSGEGQGQVEHGGELLRTPRQPVDEAGLLLALWWVRQAMTAAIAR